MRVPERTHTMVSRPLGDTLLICLITGAVFVIPFVLGMGLSLLYVVYQFIMRKGKRER